MSSPSPNRPLLTIWVRASLRKNNFSFYMLQTVARVAICLNHTFEFDNSHLWARLIHWILWTCSAANIRSRTLICAGTWSHARVVSIFMFQIEKNFLKEEIDRGWEERPSCCLVSRFSGIESNSWFGARYPRRPEVCGFR